RNWTGNAYIPTQTTSPEETALAWSRGAPDATRSTDQRPSPISLTTRSSGLPVKLTRSPSTTQVHSPRSLETSRGFGTASPRDGPDRLPRIGSRCGGGTSRGDRRSGCGSCSDGWGGDERLGGGLGGQLLKMIVDEPGVRLEVSHLRAREQGEKERDVVPEPEDLERSKGHRRRIERRGARFLVRDQLREHGIVVRRDGL